MEDIYRYKMVLFGNSGVGKTSIVERFVNNKFETDYISTLGYNVYEKRINHDDITISLLIYDIGGQEQFREIRKKYAVGAKSAFLVYDLTDEASFNSILTWRNDLKQFAGDNVPFILIGNKIDMELDRQVSRDTATDLSTQLGALTFFETSAKTGEGVNDAFSQLATLTYRHFVK